MEDYQIEFLKFAIDAEVLRFGEFKLKSGRNEDLNVKKKFIIDFVDDKLTKASGDFELSENFNTPFNETAKEAENTEPVK